MLGIGIVIGVVLIMFGMITCTQRVENYWETRSKRIKALPQQAGLPFRTSPDQCIDCGRDDEPLSIDTGQCFVCFGVVHGG